MNPCAEINQLRVALSFFEGQIAEEITDAAQRHDPELRAGDIEHLVAVESHRRYTGDKRREGAKQRPADDEPRTSHPEPDLRSVK